MAKSLGPSVVDLIGRRFGRLVVEEQVAGRFGAGKRIKWRCCCDCGNIKEVLGNSLLCGFCNSCGCIRKEYFKSRTKPKGMCSAKCYYSSYVVRAQKKKLEFDIPFDRFIELTSSPCSYCGVLPNKSIIRVGANGSYIYNTLDRIDNDKGYIESNIVVACFICNMMRRILSQEAFIEQCNRVTEFQNGRK